MVQEAVGTAAGSGAADAVGSTVQLAASLTTMSSRGATLTVTPDWAVLRSELNARLDFIEAGLQAVAPVIQHFETACRESARIGHNNPPEDIDLLPIGLAELELGILAANLARSEINSDHPRFDVLRLCGLVLRSTGGLIFACIKWIGEKGNVFVDSFLKAFAKTMAPATATVLAAKLAGINFDITEVVNKIQHLFEAVHLPF